MKRLRASGMPVRFLTNTTRSPRSAIVDLLRRLDFDVAALEYATGTQAMVVGKPAAPFFLGALGELGMAPEQAALIGDDEDSKIRPELVANDFAEAVDLILST